jgi:hypothetical protein
MRRVEHLRAQPHKKRLQAMRRVEHLRAQPNKKRAQSHKKQVQAMRRVEHLRAQPRTKQVQAMRRWLNPKSWEREIIEKLRESSHSEPLTDTWTSDSFSREGEGREAIGKRLTGSANGLGNRVI